MDEHTGVPVLRAGAPPRLREAAQLVRDAARQREETYARLGLLDAETARGRIGAPGRVFETGGALASAGTSREEALRARLQALDDQWEKLVDTVAGSYTIDKAAVARDNARAAKRARKGLAPLRTQRQEARDQAEASLLRLLDERPDDPALAGMRAALDEAERIRAELGQAGDLLGEAPKLAERGSTYVPYEMGVPGGLGARLGRGLRRGGQLFSAGSRRAISGGPKDPTLSHAFTGRSITSGFFKTDVTGASARSLAKAGRLSAARMMRDALLEAATDLPRTAGDIAIREDAFVGKGLPVGAAPLVG